MEISFLQKEIRLLSAKIINAAKSSHIGGVFSSADILAILFGKVIRRKNGEFQDSFILSKGHCCAGVYSALNLIGFISDELLKTYGKNESSLMAHISHKAPYVEFSTGSLGHGLPFGVGKALISKASNIDKEIFVLLSDGEMDEGSNWEAIHFAGHHKLDNLTAIIDYNKLQSLDTTYNTLDLEPFENKLNSFNWETFRVDGHDIKALENIFLLKRVNKPRVVICDTVKGYPISFMKNKVEWHYKPPNDYQLLKIKEELDNFYK